MQSTALSGRVCSALLPACCAYLSLWRSSTGHGQAVAEYWRVRARRYLESVASCGSGAHPRSSEPRLVRLSVRPPRARFELRRHRAPVRRRRLRVQGGWLCGAPGDATGAAPVRTLPRCRGAPVRSAYVGFGAVPRAACRATRGFRSCEPLRVRCAGLSLGCRSLASCSFSAGTGRSRALAGRPGLGLAAARETLLACCGGHTLQICTVRPTNRRAVRYNCVTAVVR